MRKTIVTQLLVIFLLVGVTALLACVVQPMQVRPKQKPPASADANALKRHVVQLSQQLPARAPKPDALQKSAQYIQDEFIRHGSAKLESFQVEKGPWVEPGTFYNVIAEFGPVQGESVIVGAHYDSFDGLPGADDNASGVAGLLELSRMLAATPLKKPVQLIAYTLEEPPHFRTPTMGSAQHAAGLARSGKRITLMISLEMIGYFDKTPGAQSYPLPGLSWIYPKHGDFIALVADMGNLWTLRRFKRAMLKYAGLPVYSISAPKNLVGIDFSDHASYWVHGLPALMVTDTAFYRNKAYHTAGDTADRLDYERMAQVVDAVFGAVVEIANK